MAFPTKLFYMIDILCNEKCSKCHHWIYESSKKINDFKIIINFVNSIKSLEEFCIVGGEPFIYEDMILNIIYNINPKIRVVIITNGVLISKEFIDKIKGKNVHIVFSIDTLDKDMWKFVRGKNTMDKVLSNFYYAHKILNPEQLSVQSVLAEETIDSVKQVRLMCDTLGVYHSVQDYISEGFLGSWTPIEKKRSDKNSDTRCIAFSQNMSIMPNGDIMTCFQQNQIISCEKPLGNILHDTFYDIISTDYFKHVINNMIDCKLPCKVLKCNIGENNG